MLLECETFKKINLNGFDIFKRTRMNLNFQNIKLKVIT